ncbi:RagB/SusD family nutrient uptake outer membrane protein [Chitinophaga solisilvae]|uniref:RagB/SusD family nutrient uptake outer membrane protein n=1 Tax=Chitinophaga solisilvae TaxID=1233460 RepID=UPI00136CE1C9|nr:RagB/SusD family nutrient uptake outer membrane protein [Chitinophaga solisilvae]
MKKTVIIALLALVLTSCKKFLAERSQTAVVPTTTKEFGEILYSNGYAGTSMILQPYLVLMDDDIQCFNGEALKENQKTILSNGGMFQWQPDFIDLAINAGNPEINTLNSWGTYYKLIMGTNVALHYLDNSIGTDNDKKKYKGEAYTLRALYHFQLVNLYARPYNDSSTTPDKSPGIPLMLSPDLSESLPVRATVKEVYDQIQKDLEAGITLLEQFKGVQPLYRMSHVAAHMLASRVYLYMEEWEKARIHADYVLKYAPPLANLKEWGDPFTTSMQLTGLKGVETIWCYGSQQSFTSLGTGQGYDLSPELIKSFEPGDLRNGTYFYQIPDFMKPYVTSDYSSLKYPAELSGIDLSFTMRTAEAYLNRAEACIQLYRTKGDAGAAQLALNDLNKLRITRIDNGHFAEWTLMPGDALLAKYREERRRELFHEAGHRWFDLRRYGMPAIRHIYMPDLYTQQIYELKKGDPQYTLPIPREALIRNPKLQQNQQLGGLRLPK